MARERYLLHVSEEELKPTESIGAPRTVKGKWENYWYHYKFHTILALVLTVALTALTVQLLTREKYDYTVTVVTDMGVAPLNLDRMEAELLPYAVDVDGNGKVSMLVDGISVTNTGSTDGYAGHQKLVTTIGSGDFMMYIVEKDVYEKHLKEMLESTEGFFRPITLSDGTQTERWNWHASGSLTSPDLQVFYTEDFVWFVRDAKGFASGKDGQAASDAHLQLVEAYIAAYESR